MFRHVVPQQVTQPPQIMGGDCGSEEETDEAMGYDSTVGAMKGYEA
eukprot:CAMPEP_0170472082 /NCGR_PEP_ID=MMETSP0123-20130129/14180_1 /TAXON_ID=182087 /ORGANISM="Favella ehrenbergii, Strain Fehren 1" /LENGTH=45 /DNA_ID= /DNA_START= /DNA_END= /DNA_ORIENTATION=